MIEKWELTIKDGTSVEANLFRNDFQVYHFEAVSFLFALQRLTAIALKFQTLPVQINNRKDVDEKLISRPIFYREIPAFICAFDGESGRILIRAEHIGQPFPAEPWDNGETAEPDYETWEDLLSPKIWWHRHPEEEK